MPFTPLIFDVMNRLFSILFLIILASCAGKESESTESVNILDNLTYSVDTVVVDPGMN